MSNAPYYIYGMRDGVKLGDQTLVDGMIKDGLWCAFCDVHMGGARRVHGEEGGRHARRSRTSSRRSRIAKAVARDRGREVQGRDRARARSPGKKGPTIVDTDEGPRNDTTAESLAKLRPAFPGKGGATTTSVTAGNASSS